MIDRNSESRLLRYLEQRIELGEKVLFLPFDIGMPEERLKNEPECPDRIENSGTLDELYRISKECHNCALGAGRANYVFGVGNPRAEILFVGEAPGAEEDRLGEPFVGRAGQLLNRILAAMKLKREDVYITNILKCRPPGNRDPLPEEAETCEPILFQQIRLIQPKIVCCLGRIAAQRLLQTNMSLGKMRDRWFDYHGTALLVTYHPAALLRNPEFKRPMWDDMQKLLKKLAEMS